MKQLVTINNSFNFCTNRWSKKFITVSWAQQNERLFLHHKFGPGRSLSYASCWKIFKVCKKFLLSLTTYILINKLYTFSRLWSLRFSSSETYFSILDLFLELQNLRVWRNLNFHWAGLTTLCLVPSDNYSWQGVSGICLIIFQWPRNLLPPKQPIWYWSYFDS